MALLQGRQAWLVFALFACGYFMSYALRSVNAVIAPELVAQFGLSNAQLGAMSSAYFLAFALMQLPLGICLDRFGSRRTDSMLMLVAACGCAVFALATSPLTLWIGRALIGAGVCGGLMSALKGYRYWYAAERQTQLAAWMLVVGTSGALAVTVPVEKLLPLVGWRGVFIGAALLLVATSAGLWFGVPRDEERALAPRPVGQPIWSGYGEVFREPYFWRWGLASVTMQSIFSAMQTLWAGPWFTQVLGMTPSAAAGALFVFNAVLLGGFLGLGWIAPRLERHRITLVQVVVIGSVVYLGLQVAIAMIHQPGAWLLWLPLGVVSTCYTLVQTHVAMTFPPALTGRAFTGFNLLTFSGMFLCQWLFGVALDGFRRVLGSELEAFRATLLVFVVIQALALVLLLVWRVGPASRAPAR